MSPGFVYKFTESITVLKLQFRINSYVANPDYCLRVEINGCTLDNGTPITAIIIIIMSTCSTILCTMTHTIAVQLYSIQSPEASPSPTNKILSNFVHPCTQQDPLPTYTSGELHEPMHACTTVYHYSHCVTILWFRE